MNLKGSSAPISSQFPTSKLCSAGESRWEKKVRELRKEIRAEINKAKVNYKDKIETEFRNKNPRAAWNGMKNVWVLSE